MSHNQLREDTWTKRKTEENPTVHTWIAIISGKAFFLSFFLCKGNGQVELLQYNEKKQLSVWDHESINITGKAHYVLPLANVLLATLDCDPAKISSPNEFSPRQYTASFTTRSSGESVRRLAEHCIEETGKHGAAHRLHTKIRWSVDWCTKKLPSTLDSFDFFNRQCSQ